MTLLAITQGDSAGIGPETIAKAFCDAAADVRGCFVVGDVATLTPVAGAAGYQVAWYPLLSVLVLDGVRVSFDAVGAVASWELASEEV